MELESAKVSETLKILPPKEAAVFKFILYLHNLEQQKRDPSQTQPIIGFNYGRTSQEIIEEVLGGDIFLLPVPENQHYGVFGWLMGYPHDQEENESHPTRGSRDIRIYNSTVEKSGNPAIRFLANQGSFRGMEKEWGDALNNINYPCLVEDRHGFHFENTSYQTQNRSSGI